MRQIRNTLRRKEKEGIKEKTKSPRGQKLVHSGGGGTKTTTTIGMRVCGPTTEAVKTGKCITPIHLSEWRCRFGTVGELDGGKKKTERKKRHGPGYIVRNIVGETNVARAQLGILWFLRIFACMTTAINGDETESANSETDIVYCLVPWQPLKTKRDDESDRKFILDFIVEVITTSYSTCSKLTRIRSGWGLRLRILRHVHRWASVTNWRSQMKGMVVVWANVLKRY